MPFKLDNKYDVLELCKKKNDTEVLDHWTLQVQWPKSTKLLKFNALELYKDNATELGNWYNALEHNKKYTAF